MSAVMELLGCAFVGLARMVSLVTVVATLSTVIGELPVEGTVLAVAMLVWEIASRRARAEREIDDSFDIDEED